MAAGFVDGGGSENSLVSLVAGGIGDRFDEVAGVTTAHLTDPLTEILVHEIGGGVIVVRHVVSLALALQYLDEGGGVRPWNLHLVANPSQERIVRQLDRRQVGHKDRDDVEGNFEPGATVERQ